MPVWRVSYKSSCYTSQIRTSGFQVRTGRERVTSRNQLVAFLLRRTPRRALILPSSWAGPQFAGGPCLEVRSWRSLSESMLAMTLRISGRTYRHRWAPCISADRLIAARISELFELGYAPDDRSPGQVHMAGC